MLTIFIIAITSVVSFIAFSNHSIIDRYIFYPPAIHHRQWYRFITYGVLHADWGHLIFNMFTLYLFGTATEEVFRQVFGSGLGGLLYMLMYLTGLVVSILPSWIKEKNNSHYSSLGASGAVSSVVFAYIIIYPMSYMGLMFIPVFLPAFIFGGLYVAFSVYLDNKQYGNINHLAHITGGAWGVVFLAFTFGIFGGINIFEWFINSISIASWSDLIRFGY